MTPGAVSTHKHQPFINRGELGWIPDVITDGADEMCGARNDPEKPWLQRYYCTRGVPATTATTSPTGINSWMIERTA